MKYVSTEDGVKVADLAEKITIDLPENIPWGLAVNALRSCHR